MKNLYFIRHGETDANREKFWSAFDTPLNETGIKQAKEVALRVKESGLVFDLIFTSPQPRAIETAKPIIATLEFPKDKVISDPRLAERWFGTLDGTKNPVASEEYFEDESLVDKYEGVEPLADSQSRIDDYWHYVRSLPEGTILIVGHGAITRALYRRIHNLPITERGQSYPNCELVKLV